MLRIYAISGSLQKASCNSGILRALINHKHPSLNIEVADIHDVPLFNEDVEKVGVPDAMKRISQKVRAADGLIFAIPENNYSPSAPMKNTYDWLSRGQKNAPVYQKPVAFVSTGARGGNRAQEHMKSVIQYAKMKLLEEPKVQILRYDPGNFDAKGDLINKDVIASLLPFLNTYAEFVKKSKQ